MAMNPIAGIGITPILGARGGEKKFSSTECLQALLDKIDETPSLVRNQINLIISEQVEQMRDKFWPAIFDPANWTRISTHRPSEDEEGNPLRGTDREVREYENDVWADENKVLTGKVTTEFGEIIDFKVIARW